jgi:hypothetical protein
MFHKKSEPAPVNHKQTKCATASKNHRIHIFFDLFIMVMKVNANIAENQGII